jgi:hypothetical protein
MLASGCGGTSYDAPEGEQVYERLLDERDEQIIISQHNAFE